MEGPTNAVVDGREALLAAATKRAADATAAAAAATHPQALDLARRKLINILQTNVLDFTRNPLQRVRACLNTLTRLLVNVSDHPEEPKYRKACQLARVKTIS